MNADFYLEKLRSVQLFRNLSDDNLRQIAYRVTEKRFAANQIIVRQGDPGEEMFLILEGSCQVFLGEESLGFERELRRYGPGDYFGEVALVSGGKRTANVRTLADSRLLALHLEHLSDLFRQSGDLALAICRGLASYVQEANRSASLSFVNLDNFPNIADVHALIPANIALHCQAIAIEKDGDRVKVALVNPSDQASRHFLQNVLRAFRVEFAATSQRDFERYSRMHLRPELADNRASATDDRLEILYVTPEGGEQAISPQEIGPVLADIFDQAVRLRASDLHLEPASPAARVRVRVDGSMLTLDQTVPIRQFVQVVSRIKVMGGMDITIKRLPQDGRFPITAGGRPLEIRASVLPCQGGEKVVLRFLDPEQQFTDFDSLVSSKPLAHLFRDMFLAPSGLVLVCGPTGSGKTTTLYAGINEIWRASPTFNILTVEDPVEYQVPFATQVPVNRAVGLDFAHILRTVLRQDPDILLVGEIRDPESAIIALEAATTGHLVLSSLHTDTALETIGRLINLNCKPALIASALRGIISQVLVPRVCPRCAAEVPADDPQIEALRRRGIWPDQPLQLPRRGLGCAACRFKGEIGRLALFDVLCVDEPLRNLIDQDEPVEKLRGALKTHNFVSRAQYARHALVEGLVAPERVVETFPATSFAGTL
jgi:type II secretory ATPase GspE/PulE/Tfp pilus assembly ATPase PilB-like protein